MFFFSPVKNFSYRVRALLLFSSLHVMLCCVRWVRLVVFFSGTELKDEDKKWRIKRRSVKGGWTRDGDGGSRQASVEFKLNYVPDRSHPSLFS